MFITWSNSRRICTTAVSATPSSLSVLLCGVPQGSVLGPILYTLRILFDWLTRVVRIRVFMSMTRRHMVSVLGPTLKIWLNEWLLNQRRVPVDQFQLSSVLSADKIERTRCALVCHYLFVYLLAQIEIHTIISNDNNYETVPTGQKGSMST